LRGECQISIPSWETARGPPVNPGPTIPGLSEAGGNELLRKKLVIESAQTLYIRKFNVDH